jgi:hypothetical protein
LFVGQSARSGTKKRVRGDTNMGLFVGPHAVRLALTKKKWFICVPVCALDRHTHIITSQCPSKSLIISHNLSLIFENFSLFATFL